MGGRIILMMTGQRDEHTFASLSSISIDQLSSKFFWHQSDRKVLLLLLSIWKSIIAVIIYWKSICGIITYLAQAMVAEKYDWCNEELQLGHKSLMIVFQDNEK